MNLKNNTILITGGGSGIGRGLAEAFHMLDNQVIIGGRRRTVLDEAAAANPGMAVVELDTTEPESIRAAADEVLQKYPALNMVINNAGVQRMHDFSGGGPLNEGALDEEIGTNIYGVIHVISAFLPHLKAQRAAAIVNVTSGLAFIPMARYPVYCATKAFVHSFTMSLRHQLRASNVRVVELAPPWVATELDAAHERPTVHEGMSPMPLAEFIDAAMQELSSNGDELPVARAKFLYSSGISERAAATFQQMNS